MALFYLTLVILLPMCFHFRELAIEERHRYKELLKKYNTLRHKKSIDTEIINAVRYAMKQSHPDKGGNSEDFIRFNNLYRSLRQ